MKEIDFVRAPLLPTGLNLPANILYEEEVDDIGTADQRIPFSNAANKLPFQRNTMSSQCDLPTSCIKTDKNANHSPYLKMDKENSPKWAGVSSCSRSPKSKLKLKIIEKSDLNACMNDEETITPGKPTKDGETVTPLTPTANLKMLISAVSPEIRNRDLTKRKELFKKVEEEIEEGAGEDIQEREAGLDDDDLLPSSQESDKGSGSRKEKSLGLLCQRFLSKYAEYPHPGDNIDICLDEVAKELNVERRRIYDIVNVLESVEMVSRVAKNKYTWHGKTNLVTTLAKLKALGDSEGFLDHIEQVKDYDLNREISVGEDNRPSGGKEEPLSFKTYVRKDKSLGIMSQRFLMLFLVSRPRTVNLDISAKILIGDPNVDKTQNAKFKTKIRRLYDIANILTSLDLIRKVHVTEIRGRKPAFKYIGPEVDDLSDIEILSDGRPRPSSRHSMLDCVQNKSEYRAVMNIMNSYRPLQPSGAAATVSRSSQVLPSAKTKVAELRREAGLGKKSFCRHASFEQICKVAETERIKLFSSQPSSPVQEFNFDNVETQSEPPPEKQVLHSPPILRGPKHVIFMPNGSQLQILSNPAGAKDPRFNQNLISPTSSDSSVSQDGIRTQEIDVKQMTGAQAASFMSSIQSAGMKPTTVVHLSKSQIDAVLRSLKVPVPLSAESSQVDASIQSSPALEAKIASLVQSERTNCSSPECTLKYSNEKTPAMVADNIALSEMIKAGKRPLDNTPGDNSLNGRPPKRLRRTNSDPYKGTVEETTPMEGHDAEVAAFSQKRRSLEGLKVPLRALHLQTEFSESPPLSQLPKLSPDVVVTKDLVADLDLASPLPNDEQGKQLPNFLQFLPQKQSTPQESNNLTQPSTFKPVTLAANSLQKFALKLPNQAHPTLVHQLPIPTVPSLRQAVPTHSLPSGNALSVPAMSGQFAQPIPVFQGVQVTPNGHINGHPLSVVVPITFTPPDTPTARGQFTPTIFTFPAISQPSISTFSPLYPLPTKGVALSTNSLVKPPFTNITPVNSLLAGSTVITPGSTPTEGAQSVLIDHSLSTPKSFFGCTPGAAIRNLSSQLKSPQGIVSVAGSTDVMTARNNKALSSSSVTARRLDMPKPMA